MSEQKYPVFEKEFTCLGVTIDRYTAVFSTRDGKKPRFAVSSIVEKVFSEPGIGDPLSPFIQSILSWALYDPGTGSEGDVGVVMLVKSDFNDEGYLSTASKFIAGQFSQQTHKG